MRKKILLSCYILIILSVIVYTINFIKNISGNDDIVLFKNPQQGTIHVYLDSATFSTELQLFDIVKRDKKTPKIISWNWERFPDLKNLEKYNAKTVSIPFFGYTGYDKNSLEKVLKEIKKIKDNDFVFHINLHWVNMAIPFLQIIPKENVKHIHIYEDGIANILSSTIGTYLLPNEIPNAKEKMEKCLKSYCHPYEYKFLLQHIYPTTYHITYLDEIKKEPRLQNFLNLIKDANIKPVNLEDEAKKITYEQKKELFEILNFDMDFYLDLIKDKKVNFFVVRHFSKADNKHLKSWYEKHKNDKNSVNFIKAESKAIENMLVPAYIFPNQVPFEILLLTGITPDSVSGNCSTLFYSLPKEKIGKIKDCDTLTYEIIKKLKNLDDNQVEEVR